MFYETAKDNHGLPSNPFKSCAVPRPIAWISTKSKDGRDNLAPYSQFQNLSFDPPYVMVAINQNARGDRKDTTINIEETGEFVYNMVPYELAEQMNMTAEEVLYGVDEFEKAGLEKAPSVLVKPMRVAASPLQLECIYLQTIRLPGIGIQGTVDVIFGKVVGIHIKDEFINADGKIDVVKIRPLARLGYMDYTVVENQFTMAPKDDTKALHGLAGASVIASRSGE